MLLRQGVKSWIITLLLSVQIIFQTKTATYIKEGIYLHQHQLDVFSSLSLFLPFLMLCDIVYASRIQHSTIFSCFLAYLKETAVKHLAIVIHEFHIQMLLVHGYRPWHLRSISPSLVLHYIAEN